MTMGEMPIVVVHYASFLCGNFNYQWMHDDDIDSGKLMHRLFASSFINFCISPYTQFKFVLLVLAVLATYKFFLTPDSTSVIGWLSKRILDRYTVWPKPLLRFLLEKAQAWATYCRFLQSIPVIFLWLLFLRYDINSFNSRGAFCSQKH